MKCLPFSRRPNRGASSSRSRGFSLVEIMVALVIGMIGVLVIMQVARTGEAQKRTTTGSGDAQSNGALAVHALQWDVKQAGYGYASINLLGCRLSISSTTSIAHLAPVTINPSEVPAGDANTDTLLIVYGNGAGSPEGDRIVGGGGGLSPAVSPAAYYKKDDWVVGARFDPVANCALVLSKVTDEPLEILLDGETAKLLKVSPSISADGTERDILYNLGSAPKAVGYAIRGGHLTACDFSKVNCADAAADALRANWQVIASDIVSLRAQYGHDSNRDTADPADGVNVWNLSRPQTSLPADKYACAWSRITALRLALVARNSEWNRDEVTTGGGDDDEVPEGGVSQATVPEWAGSEASPIDLTGISNWKHYRYQVYETVMPIRNLLGIDSTSCKS